MSYTLLILPCYNVTINVTIELRLTSWKAC